ncbi:MAG TPA: S4 domain-containing protein [Gemmatimonadaceae bacterium]|nr:RNA-binding protein [Gemmatimonadota bacterium]HNV76068.1 S4 domain-containing protein [Gemmatimonadaceae bacterium]HPV74586.1 S4 domain-containing protein [Gemmatimonadaceae bacterium]
MTDDTETAGKVRLDKWLWAARFFKTRALAAEAIDGGRIEVNGERAKRSKAVQVGDTVRVRRPPFEQVVVVTAVSDNRGSATIAAGLYRETDASAQARESLAEQMRAVGPSAFRDKGRPSKKERRDISRLRPRD